VLLFGHLLPEESLTTMKSKLIFLILLGIIVCEKLTAQQHFVIFVNGYRGFGLDHYTTDGRIINPKKPPPLASDSSFTSDAWIIGYWSPRNIHFDDSIIARYQHAYPLYVDGHHPLSTSTHKTMTKLVLSYIKTKFFFLRRNPRGILNLKENNSGFNIRIEKGRRIGDKLLSIYCDKDTSATVSIVCHSQGFAVALGIIETLKDHTDLRDFIILSPEGAQNANCDWSLFDNVWHYTSSFTDNKYRFVWRQDGIAPQTTLKNLTNSESTGLIGVPKNTRGLKLGFMKSHHLAYYHWFFDLKKGDRGYFGDY